MSYAQKGHNASNAAAFQIDLGRDCGVIVLTPEVDVLARVDGGASAPTPPGASPAPNAGAASDYLHIKAGISYTFGSDVDGRGLAIGLQDPIRWVTGWALAAGYVNAVGH